jgi:hypothetical protein
MEKTIPAFPRVLFLFLIFLQKTPFAAFAPWREPAFNESP